MPFTGSSQTFEQMIIAELYNQELFKPTDPPELQENMRKFAKAIAVAAEKWILSAGSGSVVAKVAPGISVVASGIGVNPGAPLGVSGSTNTPGNILTPTSSLI